MIAPRLLAQSPTPAGLKDHYKNYFPIGVAVSARNLKDPGETPLILSQFNSITPENAMKMGPIHPEENRYNWRDADSIVAFAQTHGLLVRGHNVAALTQRQTLPPGYSSTLKGNKGNKEGITETLKGPHHNRGK